MSGDDVSVLVVDDDFMVARIHTQFVERTAGFRVVGHGKAHRVETRIPGGDVNPYLAFAAVIAAGLYGIEHGLEPPPPLEGNAYESKDAERVPSSP